MKEYDVLVLGGGTAGTAAARRLHDAGLSVAMFNDGELGGLCILRGCMPTKTMLHAAHMVHEASRTSTPGVRPRGADFDFAEIMRNKDVKVARFKRAKVAGIEGSGYDVIDARARFVGEDRVEANGEQYRFRRGAVIATGSVTHIPPIEGIDEVDWISSDEVMALTEQPASIVTIGSGAIGLELSQFFARLGTKTTLLSRRKVLCGVDPEIAAEIERVLEAEPDFDLRHPIKPTRVEAGGPGVRVHLEDSSVVEAERLLLATGRRAAVDDLDLEAAGIELCEGRVAIGRDLRTSNPRVFIAGDATGDRQLLHIANEEGALVAQNLLDGGSREIDRRLHMEVIFSDPPVATVGLDEARARDAGRRVVTSLARFPETGRAITMDVEHGISKLVADADTGELVGAQILGPRADDLIHVIGAIMSYRGSAADMLAMPWYHPTISEVFLSQARELEAARS